MKDILESARNWHKFGFVVSATAFVLLLSPIKTDYRQALDEAYVLRSLNLDDYRQWVRGFLGQNTLLPQLPRIGWGLWEEDITQFLSSQLGYPVQGRPDWDITAIIAYEPAPTNGTLTDWYNWISSSKPASYYKPDWTSARLSASRDASGISRPPIVRHFLLRASTWHRSDGEYSFRAYIETDEHPTIQADAANGLPRDKAWWKPLDQLGSRELLELYQSHLDPTRFVVEGDVGSQLEPTNAASGIRQWLESNRLWSQLTAISEAGVVVLPGIRRNWLDLHDRSLGDAIGFMEQKQRDIQDVSLLGLTVPGQLCVIAIPIAYFVFNLFLLLDVRAAHRFVLENTAATEEQVAWLGIYEDTASILVTGISLSVIPTALSSALLIRYSQRVPGYSIQLAVLGTVGSLAISVLALRTLTIVRRSISADQKATHRSRVDNTSGFNI